MKIVFISRYFPPDPSGIGDYTAHLAEHLQRRGHEVAVVTSPASGVQRSQAGYVLHEGVVSWSLWGCRRIVSEVRRGSPDVVVLEYAPHAFGWCGINMTVPLAMLWLKWREGCRIVVTGHELYWDWGLSPKNLILALLHRLQFFLLVRASDSWVVMTEKQKGKIRKGWGIPGDRIHQIPVGATFGHAMGETLSQRKSDPTEGEFLVGLVSAMYDASMFERFLSIVSSLRQKKVPVRGLWIGAGMPPADSCGIPEMTVTGVLDRDTLARVVADVDVLLLLKSEGPTTRNTVVVSALSLGRTVLALEPVGEPRDPFWNASGILQVKDEKEMIAMVERLSADRAQTQALSVQARRFYERHFDWLKIAVRWEAVL